MLLTIGIIVFFSECKKSSGTPSGILLSHKWYPNTIIQNGQSVSMPSCESSNFLMFRNNDSGWVDESSCTSGSFTQPFQYSLSKDNKTIYLSNFYNIGNNVWNVVSLNDSKLEIALSIPITGGPEANTAYTVDWTFAAK